VGEWAIGNRFVEGDAPDAVDKVMASVRLTDPPASVSHQMFTYTPSGQPDYMDPGAIVVATEPAPEPQETPNDGGVDFLPFTPFFSLTPVQSSAPPLQPEE
jgi:hypothetical protein